MSNTFITTFRNSVPQRLTNLVITLDWLQSLTLDQIILVEQDQSPCLTQDDLPGNVQHVFCFNPGPFNKAWGMNVAARLAQGDVLIVGDADMLMDPQSLILAVNACQDGVKGINPYRRMRDLNETETRALADHKLGLDEILHQEPHTRNRAGIGEFVCFCGGIFVVQRALYFDIGGMDERFSGWGGEDDAMSIKLLKLYPEARELDKGMALHLWHPRDAAQRYGHDHYKKNLALVRAYQAAGPEELRELADTARSKIGDPERYQGAV